MDSYGPQTKLFRMASKALHCLEPTYLFISCYSCYLQVKFQQYPTIFHTLLCLRIFIHVFGLECPFLLIFLENKTQSKGQTSLCNGTEINHPTSEHKYLFISYFTKFISYVYHPLEYVPIKLDL